MSKLAAQALSVTYQNQRTQQQGAEEPQATHIERLVTTYVTFCATMWADQPWLIPWYQLEWHLAASPW